MKTIISICFLLFIVMTVQAQQAMHSYTAAVARLHSLSDGINKSKERGAALADFYYARIDEAGKEKAMTETGDILRQYLDYDFYAAFGFMMKTARTKEDMKAFSDRYMQKKEREMIVQLANTMASGSLTEKNYPANIPAPGKGVKGTWALIMDKQTINKPVAATTNNNGKTELDKGHIAYRVKNYPEAVYRYKLAADKGNEEAMYNLGLMYTEGVGFKQSYSEALNWFKKAAEKEYAAAMYNIGVMHYYAQGTPQNYAEAIQWFKKAAEKNDIKAMNNLGIMYDNSQGVPKNHTEAFSWYKKAAEKGYTQAKHNVGVLYAFGRGVQQNYPEARKWLKEAASEGYALSPQVLWAIDKATYVSLLLNTNILTSDKYEEDGGSFSMDKNFEVAPAKLNGKWGFIDSKDKVIIPFQYEKAHYLSFVEGFAAVMQNGKWGFIDKTGKTVVPFLYDDIELGHFVNGYAKVVKNGQTLFIDQKGKEIKAVFTE